MQPKTNAIGIEVIWDALKDLKEQIKHKPKPPDKLIDELIRTLWMNSDKFVSGSVIRKNLSQELSGIELRSLVQWVRTHWDDIMGEPFKHETKEGMYIVANTKGYMLTKDKDKIVQYSNKVKATKISKLIEELQIDLLFLNKEMQEEKENELQSQNN